MSSFFKKERIRDPGWLKQVREMPCVVTGKTPCDAAHIRHGLEGGTGLKPSDDLVLPLHHTMHTASHNGAGELAFWRWVMQTNEHFMMACLKAYARQLYRENNNG